MKKILTFMFVIVLAALLTIPAMASFMIFIDEFNFFVTVPDGYHVLTRDMEKTSFGWSMFDESDRQQLMQLYKDNSIYLNAISEDYSNEMVLTVLEGKDYQSIYNMNDYSDAKIKKELGKEWESTMKELGVQADNVEIYQHGDLKYTYFKGSLQENDQTVYVMLYSTVVNGRLVQCNIRSYDGPLTREHEETLRQLIDSIHFTEIKKNPNKSSGSSVLTWVIVGAVAGGVSAAVKGKSKKKATEAAASGRSAAADPQQSPAVNGDYGTSAISAPARYVCRNCGAEYNRLTAFCPNCGGNGTLEERSEQ